MRASSFKSPVLAGITAVLLSGCAAVRDEHPSYVGHGSIKDTYAPVQKVHRAKPHTAPRIVAPASYQTPRKAVTVTPDKVVVREPAPAAPMTQKSEVAPQPKAEPLPPSVTPPVPPSVVVQIPAPTLPKSAPEVTPPAPTSRPTSEGRRAEAVPPAEPKAAVPAPKAEPAPAPVIVPATPPPATPPVVAAPQPTPQPPATKPAAPAAPQVALQPVTPPKAPAPAATPAPAPQAKPATPPAAPKVGAPATAELQRVFIERSVGHLRNSNISQARAALNEALRLGETPEALTALANTFDPLFLQAYPRLVGLADTNRAVEIYKKAAGQGHKPAQEALQKLEAFNAQRR